MMSKFPGKVGAHVRKKLRAIVHGGVIRKVAAVGLVCCAAFSTALAQEGPDVNVFSFADTSCAAWERSRGDEQLRNIYAVWFRGFVSGYNFGNSANQVALDKLPDPAALALYVDKYCKENAKAPFVAAIIQLVQEIREYRFVPPKPAR